MISRRLIRNCRKLESIWPGDVCCRLYYYYSDIIFCFRGHSDSPSALFSHFVDLPSGCPAVSVRRRSKASNNGKEFPVLSNFRKSNDVEALARNSPECFATRAVRSFALPKPFIIPTFLCCSSLASHLFPANDTELRRKMTKMCE